ncbi:cytochrome c maturation protein CcmE domain-containing protein [Pseudochryseolinea flava]|uniref:Cytochrome c maturation protein CcmE n=1 Tax=Pseudochryseolinea flava TaxID=2059302 RepID=A0A364Y1B0_9BACT|nr:cytochrome c maturation protein CcmE [Pseudochryseolinea flava]RAV99739.1 cytochrome c maturation protein CcmE [Pseudochryseolinea flava]
MKTSHILIIIVIAVAIGIIITTAGDASNYVTFQQAREMALAGKKSNIHVVGELKKNRNGDIIGLEEGADKVSCSFILIDEKGREQRVDFNEPMPADLVRSEKVVVIGSYEGEKFQASKILLKCPSKYQEKEVNV